MPRFSGMRLAIQFVPPADIEPPHFLTANSGSNNEAQLLSFTITTDEKCTLALTGGADVAQFELVTTSLAFSHVLRWVGDGVQHHGLPADSDLNNTYVVQVTATDESGHNSTNQTITITVMEVIAGQPIGLLLAITKAL